MKHLRFMPFILSILVGMTLSNTLADDNKSSTILSGLKRVNLKIGEMSGDEKENALITDELRENIELKLNKAGIFLTESDDAAFPELFIRKRTARIGDLEVTIARVQLNEYVQLSRNSKIITRATTWERDNLAVVPAMNSRKQNLGRFSRLIETFINELLFVEFDSVKDTLEREDKNK